MRKFSIYAMTTAATLTVMAAMPFQALAAQNTYRMTGGNVMVIGGNGALSGEQLGQLLGSSGCTSLKDLLEACSGNGNAGIIIGGSGNTGSIGGSGNTGSIGGSGNTGSIGGSGNTGSTGGSGNTGSGSVTEDSAVAEVLSLVNSERAKAGLAPLTLNEKAVKAAQTRAAEIQTSFSHTRPDGRSFSTALTEAGVTYRASGENIAYGQTSAAQVMNSWMNSSGHRANILNSSYTEIGIGHVKSASGTDYWVQLFLN